jgi:hypothetical protein
MPHSNGVSAGRFAASLAAVVAIGTAALASLSAGPTPMLAAGEPAPVLVELFTSEGCSSCPPADALLARLDKDQPVPGARIIVLEQHVDYWDDLGWHDPFASRAATERQKEFAFALNADVYTPQMVIDGRKEVLGSDESAARRTIAAVEQTPVTEIRLAWAGDAAGDSRTLKISAAKSASVKPLDVILAMTESHLHSNVRAGENAGRGLDHDGVVRQFVRVGRTSPGPDNGFASQTSVKLGKDWKPENLRAVVFLQDPKSKQILGVAELSY